MSGINKVIVIGNLGNDPEVRKLDNGTTIATISVATSEKWKDKTTGEQKEKTEWHRCVAFNRTAEVMAEYLKKGSKVYVEGSLSTRKWQAEDGTDRYSTEIKVRDFQFLDSKAQGGTHEQVGRKAEHPSNSVKPKEEDFADADIPF